MAKSEELTGRRRKDGSYETRTVGTDENVIDASKYGQKETDRKTADEVQSSGGLGALARKLKGMPTSSSTPEPSPTPKKKVKGLIPSY